MRNAITGRQALLIAAVPGAGIRGIVVRRVATGSLPSSGSAISLDLQHPATLDVAWLRQSCTSKSQTQMTDDQSWNR